MVNAKLFLTMNPEDWSWVATTELSPEKELLEDCLHEEGVGKTIMEALNELTQSIQETMYIRDKMVNVPTLREVTWDDLNKNLDKILKRQQVAALDHP
jgi:hypothetical protein